MTKLVQKLIEESIAHWVRMRDTKEITEDHENGWAEEPYSSDCPLCNEFLHRDCVGCPVREETGLPECRKTPYPNAELAWSNWRYDGGVRAKNRWHKAANAEIAFLRSLLPKKKRKA